ncbi:MAG: ribonuclease HII [Peptococcaceae bacterium]|nr:ribonuclease HII [Peptococcaceae bacterium]
MDLSSLSIARIKELASDPAGVSGELLLAMAEDPRAGVREIHRRLKRAEAALEMERRRLAQLFLYEEDLWSRGQAPVAGVDEAGRGPLAGPVVAAAVILPEKVPLIDLKDSKKLTAAKREALAGQIKRVAAAWAIGMSTVEEIYHENIHRAGLLAMRRAVLGLKKKPACVLVDGFKIAGLDLPQVPLTGGEDLSASIAAASILAKVARDRLMESYHDLYPEYGFNRHKGYATPEHLSALARYGPCPIHRAGFQPVKDLLGDRETGGWCRGF